MKKYKALKTAIFAASALMFISASKDKAFAEQMTCVEVGVAGI